MPALVAGDCSRHIVAPIGGRIREAIYKKV